jgi:broad specificity phosphatase PhoE
MIRGAGAFSIDRAIATASPFAHAATASGLLTERADRVVKRVSGVKGNVLLFSSGHFLRVQAARWLGMETLCGRFFMISTASVNALGSENSGTQPAILFWNDVHHLLEAHNESYG